MGVPVISTTIGAEGIEYTMGSDIIIADEEKLFAEAIVGLLRDKERRLSIANNGRKLVEENYDWNLVGDKMASFIAGVKMKKRYVRNIKRNFRLGTIETNSNGDRIALNSHTKEPQGLFLQKVFDKVKPKKSLEVGLALGISTLFILEKYSEIGAADKCHIIVEHFFMGGCCYT